MTTKGYLLTIDPTRFAKLNQRLSAAIKGFGGEPLVPTSSRRAFLSSDVLAALRKTIGGTEIDKVLFRHGAEWGDMIEEDLAVAILRTREPADLPPRGNIEVAPVTCPETGLNLDWHLVEVNASGAWSLLDGPDNIDWGNVKIGHIDTGFSTHPALGFANGANSSGWIDTDQDRNFFSRETGAAAGNSAGSLFASLHSAEDLLGGFSGGHGTRTLSVLCGHSKQAAAKASSHTGQSYAGYFGIAPKVPVVPVRIEDSIWIQNELRYGLPYALDHLVESVGTQIISLSMGAPYGHFLSAGAPEELERALRNAYERGVIVICAAGNHFPDERVVFPARLPRTIAVAGSAPEGLPWIGSSYGIQVDISAPAFPIRRATTLRGDKHEYGIGDGTSFATPLVAGTAALWLVRNWNAIETAYPQRWQRVEAFRAILKATARIPTDWNTAIRGAGILNAKGLVEAALPAAGDLVRDEA